jgi:MFS family permease
MRWYYGWNIVWACMVIQAVVFGWSNYCVTFWLVPWITEFGGSRSEVMLAPALSLFMMGVFAPFVGKAMDRYSARILVLIGAVAFISGLLATSRATAIWQIVVIYALLISAGTALAGPLASQILAAKWFHERRGLAVGITLTGTSVGGLFLPHLVTIALTHFGWRQAHLYLAMSATVTLIPIICFVIRSPPADTEVRRKSRDTQVGRARIDVRSSDTAWTTATILRNRGFQIIAIAFLAPGIVCNGIIQNLGPYAHDRGFTPATSAMFMSTIAGAMLFGKVLFGYLADRIDPRYLYWLATLSLATSVTLIIVDPSSASTMLIASALLGFPAGSVLPLMGSIVVSRFGTEAFGRVIGLLYPFVTFSSIGPILTGWIRDRSGSYDSAFWIYLITLIPSAALMVLLPRTSGKEVRVVKSA